MNVESGDDEIYCCGAIQDVVYVISRIPITNLSTKPFINDLTLPRISAADITNNTD